MKQCFQSQLRAQFDEEREAEKRNEYVPLQRVRCHFRAIDTWHNAVVEAVHLDNGPGKRRSSYVSNQRSNVLDK